MTSTLKPGSPSALQVGVTARDHLRIVNLSGRLDQTMEQVLAATLADLLEARQAQVIVDLSRLQFLNSRGVSVLIAFVDELRAAGGDLKIVGAPAQAKLVLERLGIDRILQQFESEEQAVDAFRVPIEEFLSEGGIDVFVAGARGKTFHASGCSKAKRLQSLRIHPSKKAARDAGLRPCPRCCG